METNTDISNDTENYLAVPMHELSVQQINKLDPFRYLLLNMVGYTSEIHVLLGMTQISQVKMCALRNLSPTRKQHLVIWGAR